MAPKRRGGNAAPKRKRRRAGDNCQHITEAGANVIGELPLAVANHPHRLIRFHRSDDDKVFVVLTTLWRWLAGYNKNSKGEERLAKTLRRRGYCGADFTAPTDGPGVVQHIDLCFARKQKKSYAIADAEALMDFLQELDQEDIDANQPMLNDVLQRMGARPGRLITRYPRVALIEKGKKLAVVKRQGCKPRLALYALLKTFAPGYNPWYLFYRMGLKEFLAACGVHEPSPKSGSTGGCPLVLPEFEAIE